MILIVVISSKRDRNGNVYDVATVESTKTGKHETIMFYGFGETADNCKQACRMYRLDQRAYKVVEVSQQPMQKVKQARNGAAYIGNDSEFIALLQRIGEVQA